MLKYFDSSAKKKKQNKVKVRIPEEFLEEP